MNIKKYQGLFVLICTLGVVILAFYQTYFNYRISKNGVETLATVITVQPYKVKNQQFYKLTAQFIDEYGKTYITNKIDTKRSINVGEKITIIYDKYCPERADIKDNPISRDNSTVYWIGALILIGISIYSYRL